MPGDNHGGVKWGRGWLHTNTCVPVAFASRIAGPVGAIRGICVVCSSFKRRDSREGWREGEG
jgi:hypothetical protein